jgi:hypothetical protein
MTCATHTLACASLAAALPARRLTPRRGGRLAWRVLAVAALALAAYGEAWLLRHDVTNSAAFAGATCAAALALDAHPAARCTLASEGSVQ